MSDNTLAELLESAHSKRHRHVVVSVARDAGYSEEEIATAMEESGFDYGT